MPCLTGMACAMIALHFHTSGIQVGKKKCGIQPSSAWIGKPAYFPWFHFIPSTSHMSRGCCLACMCPLEGRHDDSQETTTQRTCGAPPAASLAQVMTQAPTRRPRSRTPWACMPAVVRPASQPWLAHACDHVMRPHQQSDAQLAACRHRCSLGLCPVISCDRAAMVASRHTSCCRVLAASSTRRRRC